MSSFEQRDEPSQPAEFVNFVARALEAEASAAVGFAFPQFGDSSEPVQDSAVPADETAAELAAALHAAREEGRQAGLAEAAASLRSHEEGLIGALRDWQKLRCELVEEHRHAVLEFALDIAARILGETLDGDPQRWTPIIRDGVAHLLSKERIRLRCHPEVHARLAARGEELAAALPDVGGIEFCDDPSLPEGSCVLEAGVAELDLGIHNQIESLRRSLLRPEEQ